MNIFLRKCEVCDKLHDFPKCPFCREKNKFEVKRDVKSNT